MWSGRSSGLSTFDSRCCEKKFELQFVARLSARLGAGNENLNCAGTFPENRLVFALPERGFQVSQLWYRPYKGVCIRGKMPLSTTRLLCSSWDTVERFHLLEQLGRICRCTGNKRAVSKTDGKIDEFGRVAAAAAHNWPVRTTDWCNSSKPSRIYRAWTRAFFRCRPRIFPRRRTKTPRQPRRRQQIISICSVRSHSAGWPEPIRPVKRENVQFSETVCVGNSTLVCVHSSRREPFPLRRPQIAKWLDSYASGVLRSVSDLLAFFQLGPFRFPRNP